MLQYRWQVTKVICYFHIWERRCLKVKQMKRVVRKVMRRLSRGGIKVKSARYMADLKRMDLLKVFHHTVDYSVENNGYKIPIRLYLPKEKQKNKGALLFFHGGGWVTESMDSYERICIKLTEATKQIVVSVEYRLAPENPFPAGFDDCYKVTKAMFTEQLIPEVPLEKVTLIGDSAGGNLVAGVCQKARDTKDFFPQRQILIYPAVNSDYSENSPYLSVKENGTDFFLTAQKMQDYIELYKSDEKDKENPYFAPIRAKDFSNLPKALILTAEFDPLRDEGEDYGRRMQNANVDTQIYRIQNAVHGFFALGLKHYHVQESLEYICKFLEEC